MRGGRRGVRGWDGACRQRSAFLRRFRAKGLTCEGGGTGPAATEVHFPTNKKHILDEHVDIFEIFEIIENY